MSIALIALFLYPLQLINAHLRYTPLFILFDKYLLSFFI